MRKGQVVSGFMFLVVSCSLLLLVVGSGGCGQSTETAATTTTTTTTTSTTTTTVATVSINGGTSTGVTGLSIQTFGGLAGADVICGYCTKDSESVIELKRGTTSADGTYEVRIPVASLEALKATSSGYVANLIVTISKEGTVIGCVVPSISPEAGRVNRAPTANPGDYVKQKLARQCFLKGMDPRFFNVISNIEQKFSSATINGYDDAKIAQLATSLKSGDDMELKIGAGLGITDTTIFAKMKQKAMELSRTYLEPIYQTAYTRAQLDAAITSMEAAMKAFALSEGLTDQQFSDMKAIKDKQIETKITEGGVITATDAVFKESKRRTMGNKVITLFLGQYDAANSLATINPTGKSSFATTNAAAYATFQASKEAIKAQLNTYLTTADLSPEAIPTYLRNSFFDAFVFPPQISKAPPTDEAAIATMISTYANSRIMVYFMSTFLTTEAQRQTFFASQESTMQPIFTNRFSNADSAYYLGPLFWNGSLTGGTPPTADQIQTRLTAYNAALDAAMDNNTALQSIFTAAGFTSAQATTILKAFRILMSPPDAMI